MPNHKNLPLDALKSFILVSELGNFTQAADKLARTQPAISLQIKKLEHLTEQTLFNRINGNLELTQAGETLLGYAKKMMAIQDEIYASFNKNLLSGELRLGIPSEFATTLLPNIISQFIQDYPEIRLDVTCDLSKNLMQDLDKHQYDLILALHGDANSKDSIKQEQLVWVGKNSKSLKPTSNKTDTERSIPLILAPKGCIYRHRGLLSLQQENIESRVVYTIPDLAGIQAAIEADLGVTVLTKNTVPSNLHILPAKKYNLPQLGTIGISLLSKNKTPAVEKLIEYLQKHI